MKVILDGEPKEIAALVLATQERQIPKFAPEAAGDMCQGGGSSVAPLCYAATGRPVTDCS